MARRATFLLVALSGTPVHRVVLVELLLLLRRKVPVRGDVGSVLDCGLVVGHLDPLTVEAGISQGHEALAHAEQARVDAQPVRLSRLVIGVDLSGAPDLLPDRSRTRHVH